MAKKTSKPASKSSSKPAAKPTGKKPAPKAPAKKTGLAAKAENQSLKELQSLYNEKKTAPPVGGGNFIADIPTGKFAARITKCLIAPAKNDMPMQLRMTYVIEGDQYGGEQVRSSDNLSAKKRKVGQEEFTELELALSRLKKFGVELEDVALEDLGDVCTELAQSNRLVSIYVNNTTGTTQTGEVRRYQNVYANGVIEEEDLESFLEGLTYEDPADEEDEDDDE